MNTFIANLLGPLARLAAVPRAARACLAAALSLAVVACTPDGAPNLASPATSPDIQIVSQVAEASLVETAAGADSPSPAASLAVMGDEDADPGLIQVASERRASSRSARQGSRARAVQAAPERITNRTHYIEFRSRAAASYGHTFASIGELNRDGSIATSEIVGLHPATDSVLPWMIGHIIPVPSETGPSDGDTEEIYFTSRYRITMDKERYDELLAFVRNLQASSPAWHAVLYNCNAFIGDIARHMGLTLPSSPMLFPKDYIDELRQRNRGFSRTLARSN